MNKLNMTKINIINCPPDERIDSNCSYIDPSVKYSDIISFKFK